CWGRGHDLCEHRTFWEADDYGRQLASVQREVHGIPLRERAVRCEPGTVSSRISAARSREHRDHGAGLKKTVTPRDLDRTLRYDGVRGIGTRDRHYRWRAISHAPVARQI